MTTVMYLHASAAISGGERSLLGLWSCLDRDRFRAVLVVPGEGAFPKAARDLGVTVHVVPVPSWRSGQFLALWRSWQHLVRILQQEKASLIHSYGPRNNVLAVCVGKCSRVPVIWHERNIPVAGEMDISRLLFFLPDAVIANSRAVARRFPASSRLRVIHNGVDTGHFMPIADRDALKRALGLPDGLLAGVVANLSPRKSVEDFFRMAARIGPERKDVFFVMVGGAYGPLEEERMAQLRQAVKALGLDGRVIQTGFKEDVRPWVQALDVLCHPTRQEACSRAILEAMACGAAVTAFNDGGNPELIVNNESGRLVPAGDEEALAKAVLDLLDDAPARNAMGQAARERVKEHFTLRRNAEATMELYEALRRGAIHRAR